MKLKPYPNVYTLHDYASETTFDPLHMEEDGYVGNGGASLAAGLVGVVMVCIAVGGLIWLGVK